MISDFYVRQIGFLKNLHSEFMIGKFSAFAGAVLFIIFLGSINYSVLKSPIISFLASIPVLCIVVIAVGMLIFDFKRMLFLIRKKK
jgi:hypothetical protein